MNNFLKFLALTLVVASTANAKVRRDALIAVSGGTEIQTTKLGILEPGLHIFQNGRYYFVTPSGDNRDEFPKEFDESLAACSIRNLQPITLDKSISVQMVGISENYPPQIIVPTSAGFEIACWGSSITKDPGSFSVGAFNNAVSTKFKLGSAK